jgi:hypothetical protein
MVRTSRSSSWVLVLAVAALATFGAWAAQPEIAAGAKATDYGPVPSRFGPPAGDSPVDVFREESAYTVAPSGPKVLLVQADDSTSPLVSGLLGFGDIGAVDVFDSRYGTPSLAQLQAYDVVIEWCNYAPADSTGLGNVLADYVDAGGKVILSVFNWNSTASWNTGGRIMTSGYSPLTQTPSGDHYTTACLGTHDAGSALMQGVSTACDYYRDTTGLAPGATLVASWDDGENFVATQNCVVGINSYPGVYYQFSGDLLPLYHNAVKFLYGGCSSFNKGFVDDYGRSEICYSTKTGAYKWNILSGAGAGSSYTGTASILNGGVKIVSKPGDPQTLNVTYDPLRKKANGYFIGGGYYSPLKDINTADDTPTCLK